MYTLLMLQAEMTVDTMADKRVFLHQVYQAQHEDGEYFALKILDNRGRSACEVSWLLHEAEIAEDMLENLEHPHLLIPEEVFGNEHVRCIATAFATEGMSAPVLAAFRICFSNSPAEGKVIHCSRSSMSLPHAHWTFAVLFHSNINSLHIALRNKIIR